MNQVDFPTLVCVWDDSAWCLQEVVQHPWDSMVEIPTPPKRGCVQLSYVCLVCIYFENREESHPMCKDSWNFTCAGYA
jgi:hypothetical protein